MLKIPLTFAVFARILILPYTNLRKYQVGNIIFTGRNPENCRTALKDGLLTPQTVTYLCNGTMAPGILLFPDRKVPSLEELRERIVMLEIYPEEPCLRHARALLQEVSVPDDVRQQLLDTDDLADLLSAMLFRILRQTKPQKGPELWRIERLEARVNAITGEM